MNVIKESFDSLPTAICFFDLRGIIRLVNNRMLRIFNMLSENGIQSLYELREMLETPPEHIEIINPKLHIYRFPDGGSLMFSETEIKTEDGIPYTQVSATEVTELVERQRLLAEENERLNEANERTQRLLERMPEIIREEETLAMKIRIHDDMGHSILSARRALSSDESLKQVRRSAARWKRAISALYLSQEQRERLDTLGYALLRAEEIGVAVKITGAAPQDETARRLLSLAIQECAANCVRHAGGSELYVKLEHEKECIRVSLSNNGAVPATPISEGGGLSMLRLRIEEEGGRMRILSSPRFELLLELPKREEKQ